MEKWNAKIFPGLGLGWTGVRVMAARWEIGTACQEECWVSMGFLVSAGKEICRQWDPVRLVDHAEKPGEDPHAKVLSGSGRSWVNILPRVPVDRRRLAGWSMRTDRKISLVAKQQPTGCCMGKNLGHFQNRWNKTGFMANLERGTPTRKQ